MPNTDIEDKGLFEKIKQGLNSTFKNIVKSQTDVVFVFFLKSDNNKFKAWDRQD